MRSLLTYTLLLFGLNLYGQSGPYSPAAGQAGSSAIKADSSFFSTWADSVVINRGYQDIADTSKGLVNHGKPSNALGAPDNQVVSLGDGGSAVFFLSEPLKNIQGPEFAVFENSFSDNFLELAFMEVSDDGVRFYRFPAVSLSDTTEQKGAFDPIDPTNIYNLAGKFRGGFGTPFDLDDLEDSAGMELDSIQWIRIVDVVGSLDPDYVRRDGQLRPVNDPYPTDFPSGGFDLDAIGFADRTSSVSSKMGSSTVTAYPNPFVSTLEFRAISGPYSLFIRDLQGRLCYSREKLNSPSVNLGILAPGIYYAELQQENGYRQLIRIIKN